MEDLRIRLARDRSDFDTCVLLQKAVWGLSDLEVTSAIQLIATTHAGGMLQLAETDAGTAVGFAYAFPALRGGVAHLHSDMLAVLPEHQQRGVGVRLKWAQRDEAMARGVALIVWTFDPLQARNAQPEPAPAGGHRERVLRGLLRPHERGPPSRAAHRPSAGALGPERAARA